MLSNNCISLSDYWLHPFISASTSKHKSHPVVNSWVLSNVTWTLSFQHVASW